MRPLPLLLTSHFPQPVPPPSTSPRPPSAPSKTHSSETLPTHPPSSHPKHRTPNQPNHRQFCPKPLALQELHSFPHHPPHHRQIHLLLIRRLRRRRHNSPSSPLTLNPIGKTLFTSTSIPSHYNHRLGRVPWGDEDGEIEAIDEGEFVEVEGLGAVKGEFDDGGRGFGTGIGAGRE
ncbi:hypothetical protein AKJ16_DCAP00849 [Drosera capensis]